jgi:hypothetical protein
VTSTIKFAESTGTETVSSASLCGLPLSDDASATKQMNDYGNYRQDQQNVYEPGRNVKRKKSQKPEHDENRCEYR